MGNQKILLENCIQQFKSDNEIELNESELFELFSIFQITKDLNLNYDEINSSIVDGGNDGGIDSILILLDEQVITDLEDLKDYHFSKKTLAKFFIFQCKKENSFKESALDKLITTLSIFLDLSQSSDLLLKRFNSSLVSQREILYETWNKIVIHGGKIEVNLNYVCVSESIEISGSFESKKNQLHTVLRTKFPQSSININLYSANELLELYRKNKSKILSLTFKDQPMVNEFRNGIGYIGLVKINDYRKFLVDENDNIQEELFESNIRHFQGDVDVNKKITSTLLQKSSQEDFWWLNNGITIIAEDHRQIGKSISIENVQIVNGLQTSYTIFNTDVSDEERSVLVKVIINSNKEVIDNIVASTNRQNAVNATQLRATDKIQRDIELFFSSKGYFYDRRKNYYRNQGKPLSKIFSIQNLAQSIYAISLGMPHKARATPTSLLKQDRTYASIFDEKKELQGYLNCCLIFNEVAIHWRRIPDADMKNKTTNFKFHLAWLLPKYILGKKDVDFQDISQMNIGNVDEQIFNRAVNFLIDSLDNYLMENPKENLINTAKANNFTDYLKENFSESKSS